MSIWEALSPYELTALILVGVVLSAPIHVVGMAHAAFKSVKAKAEKHGSYLVVILAVFFIIAIYLFTAGVPTNHSSFANFGSYFGGIAAGIGVLFSAAKYFNQNDKESESTKYKANDIIMRKLSKDLDNINTAISHDFNEKGKPEYFPMLMAVKKSAPKLIEIYEQIEEINTEYSSSDLQISSEISKEELLKYHRRLTNNIFGLFFKIKRLPTKHLIEPREDLFKLIPNIPDKKNT